MMGLSRTNFFYDRPYQKENDPTTGKQNPQTVSLLDDLIESNNSSLPDLSPFAEGQFRSAQKPEEQLLENFDIINSVLSACRSNRANPRIRQLANDPELITRNWSVFAEKLKALHLKSCSGLVDPTFLRGLGEIESLPPSKARAASASDFACLAHVLNVKRQCEAFERAIQVVVSTPDTDLLCIAHISRATLDSVLRGLPYE